MNLIINYFWGNKLFENNDLSIYLQSLDKIEDCQKVLFVNNCNSAEIEKISHHYNTVLYFNQSVNHLDEVIFTFLSQNTNTFKNVIICDSRDIIFQKNPFEYMENNNKDLYLTSEGMNIEQSPPNYTWTVRLLKTQRDYNDEVFLNQVVNGGVIAGTIEHVIYLLMISFTNTNRNSSDPIFNQTIYSFIEYYLKNLNFVEICRPDTSVFCITGEGVGKHGIPMKIVDGLACNENSEPYYIVHQWDRTFFADEVRSRLSKEGS
jgi:hypothetical protein